MGSFKTVFGKVKLISSCFLVHVCINGGIGFCFGNLFLAIESTQDANMGTCAFQTGLVSFTTEQCDQRAEDLNDAATIP